MSTQPVSLKYESKLQLLEEIGRLSYSAKNLQAICRDVLPRLAFAVDAGRAAIALADAGQWWSVSTSGQAVIIDATELDEWAEFPVQRGGLSARLRVERSSGTWSRDDRAFMTVASSLVAGAIALGRRDDWEPLSQADVDFTHADIPQSAELIHRVRNILSVIRVVARRTEQRATSIEDYAARLDGRINALARVQTAMIVSSKGKADLSMLIGDEMVAQSVREDRVVTSGPRVLLHPQAAQTLGITIHELAENAIRFGALSVDSGKIDVNWWIDQTSKPRHLRLRWVESGVPILSSAPRIPGFGHELIQRTLPFEFAATTKLDFCPGSFTCDLTIPLSKVARSRPAWTAR